MKEVSIIVAVAAVLIALAYLVLLLGWKATEHRTRALRLLAASRNLGFIAGAPRTPGPGYAHFNAFTRGTSPRPYNTLISNTGPTLLAGDFAYDVGASNDKTLGQMNRFSYILARAAEDNSPDLTITRESLASAAARAFGIGDIEFESAEFNQRFRVRCTDKRFAYAAVNPRAMALLMDHEVPSVELRQGLLCITDGAGLWSVGRMDELLAWTSRLLDVWPAQRILMEDPR